MFKDQIGIVAPQLYFLLRGYDARFGVFADRFDDLKDLRYLLSVIVSGRRLVQDTFQQKLVPKQTGDRSINEVLHVKTMGIWMTNALLI